MGGGKRMPRLLVLFVLLSFVFLSLSAVAQTPGNVGTDLWSMFLEVYSKVEYLGSQGINVSELVNELNVVLDLFEQGSNESLTKAHEILVRLDGECDRLLDELPDYILWRNIRLYTTVAVLALIPVLAYVFIPRTYIRLWYRFHKKWLVKEK